jgi:hypothetical protein
MNSTQRSTNASVEPKRWRFRRISVEVFSLSTERSALRFDIVDPATEKRLSAGALVAGMHITERTRGKRSSRRLSILHENCRHHKSGSPVLSIPLRTLGGCASNRSRTNASSSCGGDLAPSTALLAQYLAAAAVNLRRHRCRSQRRHLMMKKMMKTMTTMKTKVKGRRHHHHHHHHHHHSQHRVRHFQGAAIPIPPRSHHSSS